MTSRLKMFLRNWAILLLPLMMLKMWVERKILKRYRAIAVIFHDVSPAEKSKFVRIIRYLYKRFQFITPAQFESYLNGQYQLQDTSILVTFDDGFTSSRDVTAEVLDPLGIKAVFFCCTDFVGANEQKARQFVANNLYIGLRPESDIHPSEMPLTSEELASLSRRGHLIAAHTASHLNLGQSWSNEVLQKEIVDSAATLEKWLSQKVTWFAYPFGGIDCINRPAMQVVKNNFNFCFSGVRGNVPAQVDPMALPRQSITLQDPYPLQLALFYGATNWMHRKKLLILQSMAEARS
jgi:peptidoglycan/xylan/chitin deacetylase (PgdA/CDA1 family)